MSNQHYENFPVASPLLPPALRAPVRVIYAFARSADDLADEGDASPDERITALNAYERELDRIDAGSRPETDLFRRLAATLKQYNIGTQLLRDLLSAFRQDVGQTRYQDFASVLDYWQKTSDRELRDFSKGDFFPKVNRLKVRVRKGRDPLPRKFSRNPR